MVFVFGDIISQLDDFFFKNIKKRHGKFVIFRDISRLFEIKIIKLATSRPVHFLGHYLY
jgi:hypothetical protein